MRGAIALLVVVGVACQPIDGRVVTRTSSPAPVLVATVTPASAAPSASGAPTKAPQTLEITEFKVGAGQGPHDVAPSSDGGVWYTAQRTGELGYLDPNTGAYRMTKLGSGSAPHGVIVGPDGNAWVTDGGLNAIVRVDAKTNEVTRYPLGGPNVNLNTATFDKNGTLWFTGQSGYYGYLRDGVVKVMQAPRGAGPYGIQTCPNGRVFYASLAGNHIAEIELGSAVASPIDPPTRNQGARRVWCDSKSSVWVSEWNTGNVARYVPTPSGPPIERATPAPPPSTETFASGWVEWKLPSANPMAYAVFVDDQDIVWLTDFGANAIVRFDPRTQSFTSLPHSAPNAAVRQLLGRPGEVWGAMSGQDKLLVIRTR